MDINDLIPEDFPEEIQPEDIDKAKAILSLFPHLLKSKGIMVVFSVEVEDIDGGLPPEIEAALDDVPEEARDMIKGAIAGIGFFAHGSQTKTQQALSLIASRVDQVLDTVTQAALFGGLLSRIRKTVEEEEGNNRPGYSRNPNPGNSPFSQN